MANAQFGQILFPRKRRHRHDRRGNNNGNVRYETITVHKGHKIYRDTYRITYKNGHEKRKRVERVRVAWSERIGIRLPLDFLNPNKRKGFRMVPLHRPLLVE